MNSLPRQRSHDGVERFLPLSQLTRDPYDLVMLPRDFISAIVLNLSRISSFVRAHIKTCELSACNCVSEFSQEAAPGLPPTVLFRGKSTSVWQPLLTVVLLGICFAGVKHSNLIRSQWKR